MASLQSRIADLITAIGADIKALQNRVSNQVEASITLQTISGNSDQYITGTAISIPQGKIKVKTIYRVKFNVVKTAAGTTAPVFNIRVGTLGTIVDTSRASLTFAAQTGVIDEGTFEITCVFRQTGATAIIQAMGELWHRLVTTGLNITAVFTQVLNTGASFDVTGANLKIGISVNPGASSSWAVNIVTAELINLTP
jgi:hypothetical protein